MKNRDIARMAWEVIKTDLDFDDWYKECWGECMDEARALIDSGCCSWPNGSFFEVSRNISKDGQTHNFDIEKENFIEYYGEQACKEMFEGEVKE